MVQENPMSFRLTPTESEDIELLINAGLSGSVGGVMHKALDVGLRQLKFERGLLPIMKIEEMEMKAE